MARIVQNQKAELGGQPVPGLSLSRLGFAGQRELPLFLELALAITQELAKVHAAHCVHQQIDPDHIHYHAQTQKVVLSGEISSSQKQIPSTLNPGRTSNRMLYISPEQTGRMNRTLDYRTDFYSLGTVLYELLTGKPPFVSEDMVSLIYSHIAHAPQPPHLVKPQIPVQVSHIVLKLLEKNPEDRYQTSFGLISDLELCRDQLQSSGDIPEFRLCEKDFPGHIAIPEKLYGRARDIQTLTATFQQASRGEKTLFLVSGQPGMGKSALVRELHKPVAAEGGLFLEGKAGQFQREVPYQSLVTACRQGMGIVLAKPKTEQSSWCAQLKEALGENAGLVAALIPELEILLGPSSEVLPLGPQESRLRFLETFSQFLRVFATKEHPLALFLDDLQWCDSATLDLLKAILTDPRPSCLFVVGTYRENEVDAGHPLILMVQKLEREGRAVQRLELKPLHGEDIRELLGETLRTDVGSVSLLTTAVLRKTEGNPFFLHQVLYAMESQGLLRPDLDSQKWTWDEQAVADWCSPSETLVDFLVGQLKKLPPNLQDIISFAACLGVRFDLESLSFTAQQSPEVLRPALSQLADGHFLIPISSPGAVDEEIYSFLHDRIHQAASGLMEEQEQRRQHLRLGQRLWKKSAGANLAERLFEIVDHLNRGATLLADGEERKSLAELNHQAGVQAKESVAYQAAMGYFEAGLSILRETGKASPELQFSLAYEHAECRYFCVEYGLADQECEEILQQNLSLEERVKTVSLQIKICGIQLQYLRALEIGFQTLRHIGYELPSSSDEPALESGFQKELAVFWQSLGTRRIAELEGLPEMNDPQAKLTLFLLSDLVDLASIAGPRVFLFLSILGVNLSLRHGISPHSAYLFILLAMGLANRYQDHKVGLELADLAFSLHHARPSHPATLGKLYSTMLHISHWIKDPAESVDYCRKGFELSLKCNDIVYASYSYTTLLHPLYFNGGSLEEVILEGDKALAWFKAKNLTFASAFTQNTKMLALALRGQTQNRFSFSYEDVDEAIFEQTWAAVPFVTVNFHIRKMECYYLYGRYTEAMEAADKAGDVSRIWGNLTVFTFHFFRALSLLALDRGDGPSNREAQREEDLQFLRLCARDAPDNFLAFLNLVEAEQARQSGTVQEALALYDKAVAGAKTKGRVHLEALACERLALFLEELGLLELSHHSWRRAYDCYSRWGALEKVKDLEKRYPSIREATSNNQEETTPELSIHSLFDMDALIKASAAVTSELSQGELQPKILNLLMENAGADTVSLHQPSEEGTLICIAHHAVTPNEGSQWASPNTLIHAVWTTGELLICDHPHLEPRFSADPYFHDHRPASLLCLPLFRTGQPTGVLYLENQLTSRVFSESRVFILQALVAQMTISQENARLYEAVQKENEHRKKAEVEVLHLNAELEQKVLDRTSQLHAINNELEAFAYSVSHDLRAPLRSIDGFSLALLEDCAESLDESGKDYLRRVRSATQRMAQLIDDILILSRVTRTELVAERVNLSKLATTIMDELKRLEPERSVETLVQQQVFGYCDARLIRLVFENLLGNAWKFTSGHKSARIEFGSREVEGNTMFFIRDDGAGFDMKYADKLFTPFQRLHTEKEFPGTGIGLTLVQNIINRHGGRLQAEGQVEQGAEFRFSLKTTT